MLELIYNFLDSDYWDASQAIALSGGISALIGLLLPADGKPRVFAIAGGLTLLVASVIFSMIFEDLLPTLSTLPEHRRLLYALAFPGILSGISMIVYGGWRFVRNSMVAMEALNKSNSSGPLRGYLFTPKEERPLLLRLWLPGLAWVTGGFALIIFSASMQHPHFPLLGWFWTLVGVQP